MGGTCAPTTHISSFVTVAHTELWICALFFLANQNRYANEVLDMCIHWKQTNVNEVFKYVSNLFGHSLVLMPTTTHISSFVTAAHTELWISAFSVISQSEQICKLGIEYLHLVTTDRIGSACAHHYPHTKFHQIGHRVLIREAKVYLFGWRDRTYIHPSVYTCKSKWSFQQSWQPTR